MSNYFHLHFVLNFIFVLHLDMVHQKSKEIIKLYKDIIKYGKNLTFTDKEYFLNRVRAEFKKNLTITSEEEIIFQYNVRINFLMKFYIPH